MDPEMGILCCGSCCMGCVMFCFSRVVSVLFVADSLDEIGGVSMKTQARLEFGFIFRPRINRA